MCDPIQSLKLPNGLKSCCDAVASFYLQAQPNPEEKLFGPAKFFEDKQKTIDLIKDGLQRGVGDKKSLDTELWGNLQPKVIFDNNKLSTLVSDLQSLADGKSWSLQVLPAS